MSRDRWIPWALVALFAIPFMVGVTWDASFEAIPSNSESVSLGDDRIRDFKAEVRERAEEEHCWAAPGTGCPVTDNGFHREGSAAGFVQNAAPTALNNPAGTALGANHEGRIWLDGDGPDNTGSTADDNRISVWNGSAWVFPGLGALSGVDLITLAPSSGDVLRWNGTNWVRGTPNVLVVTDTATFAANEAFVNGVCTSCTVALVPDHVGGTDTNNYAEVTRPAVSAAHDIFVTARVNWQWDSNDGDGIICELEEDTNDADTFGVIRDVMPSGDPVNGAAGTCLLRGVRRNVGSGAAVSYRIKLTAIAGSEDFTVEDSGLPALLQGLSRIEVDVRPRTAF